MYNRYPKEKNYNTIFSIIVQNISTHIFLFIKLNYLDLYDYFFSIYQWSIYIIKK